MSNDSVNIETKVRLNNGVEMPVLGFGTWQLYGAEAEEPVICALKNGYRLIDTATIYQNETEVGNAIKRSGIAREEIFITTKLWPAEQGYRSAIAACERSIKLLGLSYVDLYLIHWPVMKLLNETWKAMETLLREGKCRAIGVSNYMIQHPDYLFSYSSIIPAINQVEFNPYLNQKNLLEFCKTNRIQLESYCPLTRRMKLVDPKLVSIAAKYHKTTAQVLIRWALQKGLVTIPKSSREEKIRENIDVFDFYISPEYMNTLDSFNEDLRVPLCPF
jgi:diketogulonate reductase-like aldo/keto reductase